jgi:hypothetical protein
MVQLYAAKAMDIVELASRLPRLSRPAVERAVGRIVAAVAERDTLKVQLAPFSPAYS